MRRRALVATDAWIFDEPHTPDPRVEAFLDLDPAPIYIGFGSMVAGRASLLAATPIDAARAVGRRVILAGGWAGLDRHAADGRRRPRGRRGVARGRPAAGAPAVHHGGAGTTTAVARAGVPQVILPHILDQYYWAHRVERLGLGPRGLPVDLVTADVLTERLDTALNDPRIRERAATLGLAVAARNGACGRRLS